MVQEVGHYGQGRIVRNGDTEHTDTFFLKVTLDDYVYLNQRFYLPHTKIGTSVITIVSKADTIDMQCSSLIDLLKMVVLKGDCWHKMLEDNIGNLLEPLEIDLASCGDACPFCCDTLSEYIMPIS